MLGDYLKYMSTAARNKRAEDFEKKIFPLGPAHKDLVLSVLRPLISRKLPDTELLFAFIVTKEKLLDDSEESAFYYLRKQKHFNAKEQAYIMALARLDIDVKTLEEYPETVYI